MIRKISLKRNSLRRCFALVVLVGLASIAVSSSLAQKSGKKGQDSNTLQDRDTFVPTPMDAGFGPLDVTQPSTPSEQIIQHFAAKESEFRHARDNYTYRRSVKVQTLDGGRVDGEYQQVDDVSFDPSGRRLERVVFAPENSLVRIQMSPADFADIQQRLPFVLTTEDISQYTVTYVGKQKVDELETYVFDVGPKELVKNHRYFKGRIWVDQQDLQIVVTSGKNVPDDTRQGHEDLSPPFITYREQIDGKYWFPVYTKGEGDLHFKGGKGYLSEDVHIREIVKYTDYKQFKTSIKIIYNGQDITNNKQPDAGQPAPDAKPAAPSDSTDAAPTPVQPK